MLVALCALASALPSPDRSTGGVIGEGSPVMLRRRARGEVVRTGNFTFELSMHHRWLTLMVGSRAAPEPLGGPLPVPASFSWDNKEGKNYLADSYNQHIPQYCGSCWAFAATSVLADRWYIHQLLGDASKSHQPSALRLSVQNVLSCGNRATGCGTCHGGTDASVYEYSRLAGIPDDSCSSYMAVDTTCHESQPVTDTNKPGCYTCWPDKDEGKPAKCVALADYRKLYSSAVGQVRGPDEMRAEIYARGPVSCGIDATDELESYKMGTTFAQPAAGSPLTGINHVVSVVGWGVDEQNNSYWKIRNSWGVAWGDEGFARIVMSTNKGPLGTSNNLVEQECYYGVVDRYDFK